MLSRQSHDERIFEQNQSLNCTAIVRQRKQHHIELAAVQRLDEAIGQILNEIELETAIGFAQARQNARQQEGADGRNGSQPYSPGKRLARGSRDVHELLNLVDDLACVLRDLDADGREDDPPLAAVDKRCSSKGSSSLMLALSVDWVTKHAPAARPKWR